MRISLSDFERSPGIIFVNNTLMNLWKHHFSLFFICSRDWWYIFLKNKLEYTHFAADNGFKHVQIHVEGDVKGYSNEDIQKIRETVVAFLGCEDSDVVIDGIHHDKSFVVVLAIKETLVNNMVHMDQQHIEKLCNFKVDYFILYNKTYSMEGLLKGKYWLRLSRKLGVVLLCNRCEQVQVCYHSVDCITVLYVLILSEHFC